MRSWLRLLGWVVVSLLVAAGNAAAAPAGIDTASGLLSQGKVKESLELLSAYTEAYPNDAEAHHLLCRTYYALEKWNAAVRQCETAVHLSPQSGHYHLWLGRAYGAKAEHVNFITAAMLARKVRSEFEHAVELNASDEDARSDLAEYYLEAPAFLGGGADKARNQADLLAKQNQSAALWVKARLAEKDGDAATAEALYKQSIAASGGQAEYWLDLASFYRRQGRHAELESAIQSAVQSQKQKNFILFDAALLLFRAGRDFPGAAQLVRAYLNSGDTSEQAPPFRAHYLLGSILEKQGDREGAAAEYRKALELAPDYGEARAALRRVQPRG